MRYLLVLFLLSLNLQAIQHLDRIKEIHLSNDGQSYVKVPPSYNGELDKYVKVIPNKEGLKDKEYYLRVYCNLSELVNINTNYTIKNGSVFIKLNKNSPDEILMQFENKSSLVYSDIFSKFEYDYLIQEEKLLFGLAYGIVLCAFLYNLVFYFYSRYKSFLYYSLLQITLLVMLLTVAMPVRIFSEAFKYVNVFDLDATFVMVFAVLFNMEFLNTKKYLPLVHKSLIILLYAYMVDFILILIFGYSILDLFLSSSLVIAILVLSSIIIYIKGYKPAIFYIFGWVIVFWVALLSEYNYTDASSLYLIHIGLPLESLIFSLALGYKVKQIELDKQRNEQLLIHQNKLATTGEMINNIAHQWRQPLTHISYIFLNINNAFKHNKLDEEYLEKKTELANKQLDYMSNTIDDFKDFYSLKKEKSSFYVKDVIQGAITISSATLNEHKIETSIKGEDFEIQGFSSEFAQIVLNIISNAKDAIIKNNIKEPKITIELNENHITICDNAGGIDKNTKEKIFEPYFTTKKKGTGIGLYMSKVIIETHFNGKLSHSNIDDGSCFKIEID